MPRKSQNIGRPITPYSRCRQDPYERLMDLAPGIYGREREEDIIVAVRDGQLRQRCHGGFRIIRKRTPE